MAEDRNKLTPIEALLRELHESERAGVFRPTPIDAARLLRPARNPAERLVFRLTVAGLAAAACIALFSLGLVGPRSNRHQGNSVTVVDHGSAATGVPMVGVVKFSACFAGPASQSGAGDCAASDYDGDGDVDLADFRIMQLEAAKSL